MPPVGSSIGQRTDYRSAREARIGADDVCAATGSPPRTPRACTAGRSMGDRSAVHAAEWLLARLDGGFGYCKPITSLHRTSITFVAREAARRIERTIGGVGDRYVVTLDDRPCPYCKGELVLHRAAASRTRSLATLASAAPRP
ncbi:hypothetical protein ACFVJK_42840 [Streptomyces sp. NPDC127172]|uniref:hypothetical protein n=1 Tax=Streptomyces sp. NPDC127172 TaxID=3345382 RepID=UPI003633E181